MAKRRRGTSWVGRIVGMICLSTGPLCLSARATAAQTEDQVIDAFVLAVQRSAGESYAGRSLFLAPLAGTASDPLYDRAYERLLDAGYRLYEEPSWPDSLTTLVSLGGPRTLRSAMEIRVTFLFPNSLRPRRREGYQPYRTYFQGYVLTCSEGECELSEDAVIGDGGGLIRLTCIPDYFLRSQGERAVCTVPR